MNFNDSTRLNQIINHVNNDINSNHVSCRAIDCHNNSMNSQISNFKINIYSIKPHSTVSLYRFGFIYLCNDHNFSDVEKSLSLSQIFVENMLFEGRLNDSINFLKKFSLLY